MKGFFKHQDEFVSFPNIKIQSLQLLFVSSLARCLMDGPLKAGQSGTVPAVGGLVSLPPQIASGFLSSAAVHFLAFDSPPLLFLLAGLSSLLWNQPLYRQMCLFFHLPDSPTPQIFPTTPLWSLYYWYNHFCFPSLASPSTLASPLPNPISYICCPTIQPLLNRNALDITSVCLLSTQSALTAIFWFGGKGARVSKLAQNLLNDSALPN